LTAATAAGLSKGANGHKLTAKQIADAAAAVDGKPTSADKAKADATPPAVSDSAPAAPNNLADFLSARLDGEFVSVHLRHEGVKLFVKVPVVKLAPLFKKGGSKQ